jgi:tetratricopeptide (TPR) repeat protein
MTHVQRFGLAAMVAAMAALGQASVYAQASAEGDSGGETAFIRDPGVQAAFDAGVKMLGEKNYKGALAEFNKALNGTAEFKGDPTFPEAHIGMGEALKALEDFQGAAVAFSRALEVDQNSAAAYNGRGEALLKVGQPDGAAQDFASALERDPSNPVVLANMGHILINYSRDPVGAIRRLDDAISQNDKDARAFRDRGYSHALLQDFEKAEADLKKAAEVDPSDYENFAVMANIYLFQENLPAGIDALTKAIAAYKPKSATEPKKYFLGYIARADAWRSLAEKETDQAKVETALNNVIADCDAVINDNPDRFPEAGRAQYRKGRALRMLQRYSDAVDAFTLALEGIPAGQDAEYVADANFYRGICWYYIGSHDLARGDFEQASSVGGGFSDPRVYLWIGYTHHQQGDYREAIKSYSEAISNAPKFALAHTNKGRAYIDLKEYDRAVESFSNAILAEPSVGEHYYDMGYAYTKLEDFQKAEHFLNLALRKKDPQPKMYRLMATTLRELGREELAEEYERKAEQAKPQQASGG